jgi:hypothetical protein
VAPGIVIPRAAPNLVLSISSDLSLRSEWKQEARLNEFVMRAGKIFLFFFAPRRGREGVAL